MHWLHGEETFRAFLAGMRKTITIGKRKSHGLYCGLCQCPPCVVCGKRAAEAVPSGQRHKEYYCETCGWKKKQKQCNKCEAWKTLDCYPEKAQSRVAKARHIENGRHACTQCSAAQCPKWKKKRNNAGHVELGKD